MKYFKLQYITLLILLILGVSLVPSCNKDKTPCTTCPTGGGSSDCEDVKNVKKFFSFKVGSWWVYEEETSGDRDSVYVTQYGDNPSTAAFDSRVYSTHQDYYYHYWSAWGSTSQQCSDNGIICHQCIKVKRSKYKPGDFVDEATCFMFLPIIGNKDYNYNYNYPDNYIHTHSVLDSFSIGNLDFDRTVKLFEDNTYMEGIQPTNHFFSENIGLVRKELLDSNQVWNLVSYYIQE